jgi:hypothetical protein
MRMSEVQKEIKRTISAKKFLLLSALKSVKFLPAFGKVMYRYTWTTMGFCLRGRSHPAFQRGVVRKFTTLTFNLLKTVFNDRQKKFSE